MRPLRGQKPKPHLAELNDVACLEQGARGLYPVHAHAVRTFEVEDGHFALADLDLGMLVGNRFVIDPDIEVLVASNPKSWLVECELGTGRWLAKQHETRGRLASRLDRWERLCPRVDIGLKGECVVADAELIAGCQLRAALDALSVDDDPIVGAEVFDNVRSITF